MPCACKTKKQNKVLIPSRRPKNDTQIVQQVITKDVVPRAFEPKAEYIQVVQYDFTPTVKPDELCIYCAIKHLSFALILLQQDTLEDKVVAIGQLMCARYHLRQFNKSTSIYFAVLIVKCILNEDISEYIKQLIVELQSKRTKANIKDIIQKYSIYKEYINYSFLRNAVMPLQYLAYAYALMFSQPSYQNINRIYAVGALSRAAHLMNTHGLDFKSYLDQTREIWKMIQSQQDTTQKHNSISYKLLQMMINMYTMNISSAIFIQTRKQENKVDRSSRYSNSSKHIV